MVAVSGMYLEAFLSFAFWLNSGDLTAFTIMVMAGFSFLGHSSLYFVSEFLNDKVNCYT